MKREVDERELRRLIAEVTREVTVEDRATARRASGVEPTAEVCAACAEAERRRGQRAVVTTTGKNRRGIVANIAQSIAAAGGDILDIAQTLAGDFFTMIIVVDISALEVPFADFKSKLVAAVEALGAHCLVMHEEIVNALQRV
jgi:ACT domain-containing protein